MRRSERPLSMLPRLLLLGFIVLFVAQLLAHHASRSRFESSYRGLSKPLELPFYQSLSMGSEQLLGYLLAIRIQLHDNQAGKHFRYNLIDYDLLIAWLDRVSDISPETEYPMLLASRIYAQTRDRERLQKMLAFIERRFDDNPQLHWRRLAEASIIAKHRLEDLDFALRLAKKLAAQPASVKMPHWARDFEFLLLAELNELESAIAIIQAMLQSNSISDPDELRFLREKLSDFQQKLFESQQKGQ